MTREPRGRFDGWIFALAILACFALDGWIADRLAHFIRHL